MKKDRLTQEKKNTFLKKQGKRVLLAAAVLTLTVTGCGKGGSKPAGVSDAKPQRLLTHEEIAILDYVEGRTAGNMTAEEYLYLARLYGDRDKFLDRRNVLEECFQLLRDEEAFAQLQEVWVDLEEETDETLVAEGKQMYESLSTTTDRTRAVNLLAGDSWLKRMMPKLYQGRRNYFLQQDEKVILACQVGYGESGCLQGTIWYPGEDGAITVLCGNADKVVLLTTGLKDGLYDGAFEAWTCEAASGNVFHEKGTFLAGKYCGAYSVQAHLGTEGSELTALWSNKESLEYQEYTGAFDTEGRTLVRQNEAGIALVEEERPANYLVYACDEALEQGLYLSLEAGDPLEYVFTAQEVMGIRDYPQVEVYRIKGELDFLASRDTQTEESLQTRVYDGEIQVYVNGTWYSMGPVEEYVQQDPMSDYRESGMVITADGLTISGMAESGNISADGIEILESEGVEKPAVTAKPTARPTTAPTARPTTAPTARPTMAPTVRPTTPPTARPTTAPIDPPAPTIAPTPVPTPEPTTAPIDPPAPTMAPTPVPTPEPTTAPIDPPAPTMAPTPVPTPEPTTAPIDPPAPTAGPEE